MRLDTVESDVIHAIGYDDEVNVLEVIFNNGSIYQYRGVPAQVYREFMASDSKGRYFQENVRDEFEYWQFDAAMAQFIRGNAPFAANG